MNRSRSILFLLLIIGWAVTAGLSGCLVDADKQAVALNNKGLFFLNKRNYDSAIYMFKKAVQIKSVLQKNKINILRNVAITYSEMDEKDSAKIFYKKAVAFSSNKSYDFLINNADVAILEDNIPQAITYLQAAWDLNNAKVDVNNGLGLIYLGEYGDAYLNPDKALRYNLKAFEINKDRNTQFVLGKNYYQLKKYDKALEIFNLLHEEYPDYTSYLTSLILIHEDAGHTADAEKLKEKLKKQDPEEYEESFGEVE